MKLKQFETELWKERRKRLLSGQKVFHRSARKADNGNRTSKFVEAWTQIGAFEQHRRAKWTFENAHRWGDVMKMESDWIAWKAEEAHAYTLNSDVITTLHQSCFRIDLHITKWTINNKQLTRNNVGQCSTKLACKAKWNNGRRTCEKDRTVGWKEWDKLGKPPRAVFLIYLIWDMATTTNPPPKQC